MRRLLFPWPMSLTRPRLLNEARQRWTEISTTGARTSARARDRWKGLIRWRMVVATSGVIVFLAAIQPIPKVDLVAAQSAPGLDCDGTACIIWGLSLLPGTQLLRINTCTGIVAAGPIIGAPGINTIAAAPMASGPQPNLTYGAAIGGQQFCTSGFPPLPAIPCGTGVAPGTNGLARDGLELYASGDTPVAGSLSDPLNFIGAGAIPYTNGVSDIACDATGRYGLVGEAQPPPGVLGHLFTISRGNGAQTNPRPAVPRVTFSGLAFDGGGRLWGSDMPAAMLHLVDPNTGLGVPTFPLPVMVVDLASDECNSCTGKDERDLGDAPDSTNHFSAPMLAYPGVPAAFPSVRDLATGLPAGPFHRLLSQDSWLGDAVTHEEDADLPPDADLVTNLDPPLDIANRDGADDGVQFPISLPQCQLTQFTYRIRVATGVRDRYTNVWLDLNRNGQWGDTFTCQDQGQVHSVSEWVVQDQPTSLGAGLHLVTTPAFRSVDPEADTWMRISLAETTAPSAGDGRGYDGGYEIGESEDYLLAPRGGSQYQ